MVSGRIESSCQFGVDVRVSFCIDAVWTCADAMHETIHDVITMACRERFLILIMDSSQYRLNVLDGVVSHIKINMTYIGRLSYIDQSARLAIRFATNNNFING